MPRPTLTREFAWSAAQDAANRSMRAANRASWDVIDYNIAVEEFNRLMFPENPRLLLISPKLIQNLP